MAELLVLAGMLAAALIPFGGLTVLVRSGKGGLALSIASVIGGALAVFLFASGRPIGVDPVFAMGLSMLGLFPALLGCAAGGLMGWMLRRRDDRRAG
jgi:hypothetical protein